MSGLVDDLRRDLLAVERDYWQCPSPADSQVTGKANGPQQAVSVRGTNRSSQSYITYG